MVNLLKRGGGWIKSLLAPSDAKTVDNDDPAHQTSTKEPTVAETPEVREDTSGCRVYSRSEHPISRKLISKNALKVLYRLHDNQYQSYLVGGSIRDILLDVPPKDFDVVTNATPEQIKAIFRNCRLIGRRFRLAHILFGHDIIEVATYRAAPSEEVDQAAERILSDNVFGSIEEDVLRRDFTINAMYYNIANHTIVDYVGGMEDIKKRQIRLLGDPERRYTEDPVRILRAVRFAAKLGFDIEAETAAAIPRTAPLLRDIPPARLFEEVLKLFQSGHAVQSMAQLRRYDLLTYLFPLTAKRLAHDSVLEKLLLAVLENTDERCQQGKPVTPAFLYAAFLWRDVEALSEQYRKQEDMPPVPAIGCAADDVIRQQISVTALPKRFSIPAREIWSMQPRLEHNRGKRALKMLAHPKFRAGYDFLALRARVGDVSQECVDWWTKLQNEAPEEQQKLARRSQVGNAPWRGRRRRRRGGGNKRAEGGGAPQASRQERGGE